MNVLKEEDRKTLLTFLFENASDQVLVTAVADCKAERENTRNQFISLMKYIGTGVEKRVETSSPVSNPTVSATQSVVSDPPGEACSKIGANTRATLLARCKNPTKPEHIGRDMYPQMKLLWNRGDLLWDGISYITKEGVK
jgi:hypothetical protein